MADEHTHRGLPRTGGSGISSSGSSDDSADDMDSPEMPSAPDSSTITGRKLIAFWKEKGGHSSPLRLTIPVEFALFDQLSRLSPTSHDLALFANAIGEGVAGCRCAGGRLKNAEKRAILAGRAVSDLRSSVALCDMLSKCLRQGQSTSVRHRVSAIVASSVHHLWTMQETSIDEPQMETDSFASHPCTSEEERKVAYHGGWTLKRVRERVIVGRSAYEALAEDGSRLQCTGQDVLLLIARLATDYQEEEGRHLLRPYSATCAFFERLHTFAEAFFSEKVSPPLPDI